MTKTSDPAEHHGKIWWTELLTNDLGKATDYYAATAGWVYEDMNAGGENAPPYKVARRSGQAGDAPPVAGIMDMSGVDSMKDTPARWMSYIAVKDVAEAVRHTREAGGEILRDVFEVPGIGRIAVVADPAGAVVGMMTPA